MGKDGGVSGWFEGCAWPEDGEVGAFLARVQSDAEGALDGLVAPEATSAFPVMGCLLTVEVPGIPASEWPVHAHQLQVLRTPGFLGGYWGCSHLWDEFDPDDPDSFSVDAGLAPEVAAAQALAWVRTQLVRPRAIQEWDRKWRTPGRRWILEDTGTALGGPAPGPRARIRTTRLNG